MSIVSFASGGKNHYFINNNPLETQWLYIHDWELYNISPWHGIMISMPLQWVPILYYVL